MFGRKKTGVDDPATAETEASTAAGTVSADGKKGRPTPKRKDQEAARRQPLVPADRKAAAAADKAKNRQARIDQRAALARGDESALPMRDRGPIKRYIRDSVDSRWNVGEIILPLMLLVLVLTLMPNRNLQMLGLLLVWAVVVVGALDAFLLWRRLKGRIQTKFSTEPPARSASYAIMRAFQMRMSRMPRPQVKRGADVN